MSYDAIGYWVTCDEALCASCFGEDDYIWPGFESWDKPLTITGEDESDTPTHCDRCKDLIEHGLTKDGFIYVESAIEALILDNNGEAEVVRAWWQHYKDDLDWDDIIDNAIEARI